MERLQREKSKADTFTDEKYKKYQMYFVFKFVMAVYFVILNLFNLGIEFNCKNNHPLRLSRS